MTRSSANAASPWPAILLIVGAGIVSAFQVGKAPLALSVIQSDLGMGLAAAAWLMSAFAIVGAIVGAPIGLAADRLGARHVLAGGLLVQGLASLAGALSAGPELLMSSRVIEGVGFLAVAVAAPALIVSVARGSMSHKAMALWATFMPVGMTVVMLAAPLLDMLDWRGFWALNAFLLLVYAAAALAMLKNPPPRDTVRPTSVTEDMARAMRAFGPWGLAGLFAAFATVFFAVFGFLPSILVERLAIVHGLAATLTAMVAAASGIGNLVCGQLLARGVPPFGILAASFGIVAICGFGVLFEDVPGRFAFVLALVMGFVGGFIPVVLLSDAARFAPHPDLTGVTLGFVNQGNNIGMLAGPAAAGALAAAFGWSSVGLLVAIVSLSAIVLAAALYRSRPYSPSPIVGAE